MRFLTLAEALMIGEAVTGTSAAVLARGSRLDLLDSALHAPQAGFGEIEFYPEFRARMIWDYVSYAYGYRGILVCATMSRWMDGAVTAGCEG